MGETTEEAGTIMARARHSGTREAMNEADNTTGENCTRAAPAPSYLALHESGELARRVGALERLLTSCRVCPLDCGNDRTRNELARCFSAALPVVSSYHRALR